MLRLPRLAAHARVPRLRAADLGRGRLSGRGGGRVRVRARARARGRVRVRVRVVADQAEALRAERALQPATVCGEGCNRM